MTTLEENIENIENVSDFEDEEEDIENEEDPNFVDEDEDEDGGDDTDADLDADNVDEPTVDEPTVDEPEPIVDEPTVDEPIVDEIEPIVDEPEPYNEKMVLNEYANNKKLDSNTVMDSHMECRPHNYDEIHKMAHVTRNSNNIIIDMLHTTVPILTKYEKTKIIGQRTKQLDMGSKPFIEIERTTLDNSLIAEEELYQKKMPFIIQRPLPNGGFEYWHVRDLEILLEHH